MQVKTCSQYCYTHGTEQDEKKKKKKYKKKSNFSNLKNYAKANLELQNNSLTTKEIVITPKIINILKCRGVNMSDILGCWGVHMSDILQYDLIYNNFLFDNDFTSKSNNYMLVKKLEENLINKNYMEPGNWLSTFQDLLTAALKHIKGICKFKQTDISHDSYGDDSLEECKRWKCDPSHLNDIEFDTRLTIEPDGFCTSASNKEELHTFGLWKRRNSHKSQWILN